MGLQGVLKFLECQLGNLFLFQTFNLGNENGATTSGANLREEWKKSGYCMIMVTIVATTGSCQCPSLLAASLYCCFMGVIICHHEPNLDRVAYILITK